MEKRCLSCMKKIPLMAHRCPYCREEGKEVHGRLLLLIIFLLALWFVASNYKSEDSSPSQNSNDQELIKALEKIGVK